MAEWWSEGNVVVPMAKTWSDAADQIGTATITVLTYDSLLNEDVFAAVKALDPEWLVVDEAHNLKKRSVRDKVKGKPKARKTKSGLLRSLPGRRRVAISGTPIPNRWPEVWTLLNIVAPEQFTSYWQFVETLGSVTETFWGGKEISVDIIRQDIWKTIFDRWIIARPRPAHGKIWDFVPVELSAIEARAYKDMQTEMRAEREGHVLDASNALAQLTRLQQLAGALGHWETKTDDTGKVISKFTHADPSSKTDKLLEMLEGLDRAVVFTRFRDRAEFVANKILEELRIEPLLFTGGTSEVVTELYLERFKNPDLRPCVAVCVYGTISEGINDLVIAHDIFFLDWSTVKDVEQAADRLDRPGQTQQVRCVTLYAEGTVDELAINREAGKVRPLRGILRDEHGWAYLEEW